MQPRARRVVLGTLAVCGLFLLFIFQGFDFAATMGVGDKLWRFTINRTIRFLLNDSLVVLLIYSLFAKRSFTRFAFAVQILGFLFLLLPYLILKFQWPAYNGPMISHLHRLIVNPLLMLLLIPAFYLQHQQRT
jgi:exosortase F-associated protein